MTMKKEYISPEVEVIEMSYCSIISSSIPEVGDNEELGSRENYREDYHRPNRPGSTNIWDQGW